MLTLPRRSLPKSGRRRVDRIPRPHVGIISTYFNRKGVATDARAMEFGLRGQAFIFPVRKLSQVQRRGLATAAAPVDRAWWHPQVAPPGMTLARWLEVARIDLVVTTDHFVKEVFDACRARGIKTCFAPHLEALDTDDAGDLLHWPGVVDAVLAKTARTGAVVSTVTDAPVHQMTWSTFWPIEAPEPMHDPVCVYFNLGIGGLEDRRHVPLVMETLGRLLPRFPHVRALVKCHPHVAKYYPDLQPTHERMELIRAEYDLPQMIALQRQADLTLYPSRFEGLGYPLLESLHCGVPVVTTDASPMNEFVVPGRNGWLVPCRQTGRLGAAPIVEVDADAFETLLAKLFADPERIAAMKATCTDGLAERADAFQFGWRTLLRRLYPRALNVGAGEQPHLAAYNVDVRAIDGVDVVALADALPFLPESFGRVGAYDVLEHVPRTDAHPQLAEWVRVLKAEGTLEVRVPDLRALARKFLGGKLDAQAFALYLYGNQDHAYNFHKAGYDEPSLTALLAAAGLAGIERITAAQSSKNVLLRAHKLPGP